MAYEHINHRGIKLYLRKFEVVLRGGKQEVIYFFTRDPECKKGTPCDIPDNYTVYENEQNGYVSLKKTQNYSDNQLLCSTIYVFAENSCFQQVLSNYHYR